MGGDPVIPLSLARIAQITGGQLAGGDRHQADPEAVVSGEVVIDSRRVSPGGLFAAVAGERSDGHDFAAAAVSAGAVAVLATRSVPVPSVLVDDVPAVLAALARAVVDALPAAADRRDHRLVGQDLDQGPGRPAGGAAGPDHRAGGFVQQRVRPPSTVLRADASTRYLVLELSARGLGHIAYLCRVAPPGYGVVLNVGHAHAASSAAWTRWRGPRASCPRRCPPTAWPS